MCTYIYMCVCDLLSLLELGSRPYTDLSSVGVTYRITEHIFESKPFLTVVQLKPHCLHSRGLFDLIVPQCYLLTMGSDAT